MNKRSSFFLVAVGTVVEFFCWGCVYHLLLLVRFSDGFLPVNVADNRPRYQQLLLQRIQHRHHHSSSSSTSCRLRLASSSSLLTLHYSSESTDPMRMQDRTKKQEYHNPWSSAAVLDRSYYLYNTNMATTAIATTSTTTPSPEHSQRHLSRLWEDMLCPPNTHHNQERRKKRFGGHSFDFLSLSSFQWSSSSSSSSMNSVSVNNNNHNNVSFDAIDVTIVWDPSSDDPEEVARRMLQKCLLLSNKNFDDKNSRDSHDAIVFPYELVSSLADSLLAFSDFCRNHIQVRQTHGQIHENDQKDCRCCPSYDGSNLQTRRTNTPTSPSTTKSIKLKCRIVATRGPSGAKCPQYHMDHVPVRWIQTFVGPGVDIVEMKERHEGSGKDDGENDEDGIAWHLFGKDYDDDDVDNDGQFVEISTQDRNNRLVDPNRARICNVQEGQAVLMVGTRWNGVAAANTKTSQGDESYQRNILKPVIHKSPEIRPGCARVLLTQDVIVD